MATAKTTKTKAAEPNFFEDFSNLQADIGRVDKSAINPHFKSRYADLPTILEAIREPLKNNNFIITMRTEYQNESLVEVTELIHVTGEKLTNVYPIIAKDMTNPQAQGSGLTYARRYSLQNVLNLQVDDDDGNSAATPPKAAPKEKSKNELANEVKDAFNINSPDDLAKLSAKVLGVDKETKTFQTLGIADLNKILKTLQDEGKSAPF